jgi:hypothetical protein
MLPLAFGMSEPPTPALSPPNRIDRTLASLQAGVLAALASFLLMGMLSRLEGRSFWTIPNLMSGLFHGYPAIQPDFSRFTVNGLALHCLGCVLLAFLYSQAIAPTRLLRSAMIWGPLSGSLWFYLWDGFFWRKAFPPFATYSKRPSVFLAFVLAGFCVGLYSIFVRSSAEPQN